MLKAIFDTERVRKTKENVKKIKSLSWVKSMRKFLSTLVKQFIFKMCYLELRSHERK